MTTKIFTRALFASLTLSLFACQSKPTLEDAESKMSEEKMKEYIQILASDEFQGRKPFSEGETKTIEYISNVYADLGLETINEKSYLQEVPLVEVTVGVDMPMNFTTKGKEKKIRYKDDFVIFSRRLEDKIEVENSELVFAGYGIVAPSMVGTITKILMLKEKLYWFWLMTLVSIPEMINYLKGMK